MIVVAPNCFFMNLTIFARKPVRRLVTRYRPEGDPVVWCKDVAPVGLQVKVMLLDVSLCTQHFSPFCKLKAQIRDPISELKLRLLAALQSSCLDVYMLIFCAPLFHEPSP
mmetsp:Transcript_83170/g.165081  ORF Transcript_83170/g.165081 Transcript_83170/m.165081 type:complete len:110 (-) Transcript_83170:270-599(-)